MISKKDYLISLVIGFFTGTFALFIFSKLKIHIPYQTPVLLISLPVIFSFGVWVGKFLGRWIQFFSQFGKFAVVGFLSAAIDFSILNIVSSATGITAGATVGWVNVPGFLAATVNGYLWNKLWVFKSIEKTPDLPSKNSLTPLAKGNDLEWRAARPRLEFLSARSGVFHDFPRFISVTIAGLLINSVIIILLTTYAKIPFELSAVGWLNAAKILASGLAMIWNFLGYKFFAFKIKTNGR